MTYTPIRQPVSVINVLNVPARLVTDTRKYHRVLSTLIHDQLHWLNVPEPVEYKLAVMVRRCLENKAPRYLVNCCTPVADVASRHRRSANLHRLLVPRHRRSTLGRRAFSVGGPTVWNSLPVELREPAACERRCLSAHIEDDLVREILVHRAQLKCVA